MKKTKLLLLLAIMMIFSCKKEKNDKSFEDREEDISKIQVEVQGHRGERGYWPENTLPGFISAVKKGVDVLELDVVISKDKKVVVSHEPYMSSVYMLNPQGNPISKDKEKEYNIYTMNYDSIKKFDAGSRGNLQFPKQKKIKVHKPLLSEVIDSIEKFIQNNKLEPVGYNIELKSAPRDYGVYQPAPEEFVDLVMDVLEENNIGGPFNIQSFDTNILQVMNKKYPDVELAYLVSGEGIDKNLAKLGFKPEIYSPNYAIVKNTQFVDSIKEKQMRLIPWTVNRKKDIKRMLKLKVDGIITDYPSKVIGLDY